ncbi:DUF6207 family protein [Streptomyces sp. R41]|uniref:DUF6207 family protein n=1 Tax=Streptomyces sp. R41 TaxID=3238632 RepID=A0AB39RTR6_9ACTN
MAVADLRGRHLAVLDFARTCATAPADRTTRDPGQPGVRLRLFLDLRQTLPHQDGP